MEILLAGIYSFIACIGFCLVFNLRGKMAAFASLGGALGWCVFLLCANIPNDIPRYFIATILISVYAEMMARMHKVPVTVYLIVGLLPLVPGAGIYYTMEYCINGQMSLFVETGLHTMGIAGALALGILLVSSLVRLWGTVYPVKQHKNSK